MIAASNLAKLHNVCEGLYNERVDDVPFHGWHHVEFVASKAALFARELGADEALAVAAAYTHDLNYLVGKGKLDAASGSDLRRQVLRSVGITEEIIDRIEVIVREGETGTRNAGISPEAQALSDADTLFKALPITPVVLAPRFMEETGYGLRRLAEKITSEQVPLRDQEIYFYSQSAREKYGEWGDVNLRLWQQIVSSLDDPDIVGILAYLGVKI